MAQATRCRAVGGKQLSAAESRVVFVHLRRPTTSNPNEMRSDPFWEFGSFGCTGCHSTNLMNLARIDELEGVRFAFAQGGTAGIRLVKVTPPVTIVKHPMCAEVRWTPARMPLRYDAAPLLIDNKGNSDVALLRGMIANVNRSTWMGRFASKFRSSRQMLPQDVSMQVISVFNKRMRRAGENAIASSYAEALPFPPPHVDTDRERTYGQRLAIIRKLPSKSGCRRKTRRLSCPARGRTQRSC